MSSSQVAEQSPGLPEFDNPPVEEVALSVIFEELPLTGVHTGLLWQKFRDRFPNVEDKPPVNSPREEPVSRAEIGPTLQLTPMQGPPKIRTWFLNADKTELVQIQPDRFSRNWRRADTDHPYPRYARIRKPFEDDLGTLNSFLDEQLIGQIKPVQAEVTYVNHISPQAGWERHGQASSVFSSLRQVTPETGRFLPESEESRLGVRYVMRNEKNEFVGRLHASVQPAFRRDDNQPLFVFQLTARGIPTDDTVEGALRFIELGHEWIVRGFADLTTPQMHKAWGRTR